MNSMLDVMVLSSDLETRRQLMKILESNGIDPICSSSIRDCRELLAEHSVDLISCDSGLTDGTYRELLETAARGERKIRIVVTSRQSGLEEFLEAARLGAFDMIATPCVPTEVESVLSQVVRARRTERQAAALAGRVPRNAAALVAQGLHADRRGIVYRVRSGSGSQREVARFGFGFLHFD